MEANGTIKQHFAVFNPKKLKTLKEICNYIAPLNPQILRQSRIRQYPEETEEFKRFAENRGYKAKLIWSYVEGEDVVVVEKKALVGDATVETNTWRILLNGDNQFAQEIEQEIPNIDRSAVPEIIYKLSQLKANEFSQSLSRSGSKAWSIPNKYNDLHFKEQEKYAIWYLAAQRHTVKKIKQDLGFSPDMEMVVIPTIDLHIDMTTRPLPGIEIHGKQVVLIPNYSENLRIAIGVLENIKKTASADMQEIIDRFLKNVLQEKRLSQEYLDKMQLKANELYEILKKQDSIRLK